MKKFVSIFLALTLTCSLLAGCGNSSSDDNSSSNSDSAEGTIKVGMVTDTGGINDKSFNQTSWEGLQKASEDLGIEVKYLESATDADYSANIETFVDEEYDLIICVGFMLADALKEAAANYPDQNFAIIDDESLADVDNVASLMFDQEQGAYLVGYLAGMTTQTNTIGFVLGMSTGPMNEFGYGYLAGAIDANQDIKVLQYNANSFSDATIGKTAAVDMINNDADIIFAAAGATGSGSIEACVENDTWCIGVDTDQSDLAPSQMLTSAMKRVDSASYAISEMVLNNEFKGGVYTYGLTDGGIDIAPTQDNLTEEQLAKIEELKQQIIDGDIVVPATQDEFEAAYGKDVYELD